MKVCRSCKNLRKIHHFLTTKKGKTVELQTCAFCRTKFSLKGEDPSVLAEIQTDPIELKKLELKIKKISKEQLVYFINNLRAAAGLYIRIDKKYFYANDVIEIIKKHEIK